jgi:hypothetical protein
VLAAHGMQVVLGTPTASPPPWLMAAHPDAFLTRANGHAVTYGNRRNYSPSNEAYRDHTRRIVEAMAERYREHPAVIGWQIDNEFGDRDYDAPAFRRWLRRRFGTLDVINERWGTAFWSHTYTDWDQIPVPLSTGGVPNPGLALDFYRFCSDAYVDYQRLQIDILRERCPKHFITHNLMGFRYPLIDYFDLAADLDLVSWDNYPRGFWNIAADVDSSTMALGHATMRGLKGKPFWVMEAQAGAGGWDIVSVAPKPGEIRLWAYQAIAHGADGIVFFRWRTARHGTEQYWHGLLEHDARPGRRYDEVKAMGQEIRRIGADVAGATVEADVAMVLSYDARFALEIQPNNPGFSYPDQFQALYRALHRRGVAVDVVSPAADLSAYRVVIAPASTSSVRDGYQPRRLRRAWRLPARDRAQRREGRGQRGRRPPAPGPARAGVRRRGRGVRLAPRRGQQPHRPRRRVRARSRRQRLVRHPDAAGRRGDRTLRRRPLRRSGGADGQRLRRGSRAVPRDGRQRRAPREQRASGREAARRRPVALDARPRFEASSLQRRRLGLVTEAGVVPIEGAADLGERAVPELEQVSGREVDAVSLVDDDRVDALGRQRVDHDEWRVAAEALDRTGLETRHRRDDDDAVEVARAEPAERAPHLGERAPVDRRERQPDAPLAQRRLEVDERLARPVVAGAEAHQADGVRPARHQRPRGAVRPVAEELDRLGDPRPRGGRDAPVLVDHPRDRLGRHARAARDVLDGRPSRAPSPSGVALTHGACLRRTSRAIGVNANTPGVGVLPWGRSTTRRVHTWLIHASTGSR